LIQLSVEDYWTRTSKSWLKAQLLQTIPLAVTERTSLFLLDQTMAWSTQLNVFRDYCIREDHAGLLESIASIQKCKEFGIHLTRPWQVVIAGRPNVGKSSLINALAGFSRAIVHEHPGTTRDVISQRTAFDGWPVELRDTAGLRVGTSEIESLGIEKAWEEVRSANCRIAVFDASQRWTEADRKLVDEIQPQITAFNKVDHLCHDATRPNGMFISATQNHGVDELGQEIARVVVRHPPSRLQAVPFNERLDTWLDSLSQIVLDRNWEKVRQELDGLTTDGEL
jgi:tRNA modification GTPase